MSTNDLRMVEIHRSEEEKTVFISEQLGLMDIGNGFSNEIYDYILKHGNYNSLKKLIKKRIPSKNSFFNLNLNKEVTETEKKELLTLLASKHLSSVNNINNGMYNNILKYGDYNTIIKLVKTHKSNNNILKNFAQNKEVKNDEEKREIRTLLISRHLEFDMSYGYISLLISRSRHLKFDISNDKYDDIFGYGDFDSIMTLITRHEPDIDSGNIFNNNEIVKDDEKKLINDILSNYNKIKEDEKKCNEINSSISLIKPYPTIKYYIVEATKLLDDISKLILQYYAAYQFNCILSSSSIT